MKRIFIVCSLYIISLSVFAQTCPQPQSGYIFRVAAWGNHTDATSQVRCYYYYRTNERVQYKFVTPDWFTEEDMDSSWGHDVYRYNLCVSANTNVNDCPFSHV